MTLANALDDANPLTAVNFLDRLYGGATPVFSTKHDL